MNHFGASLIGSCVSGETSPYGLLSVIVPVYNERNSVGEMLRRMRQVDLPIDREIVVVDDGSVDGTDKVLAALADSTVKVVTHPVNCGIGPAVRTGLAASRGDVVLIKGTDLAYDPQEWPRLLAPLLQGRTKVVFGSRHIGEREIVSIRRRAGGRSLSVFAALLFNATISDVETGCKVIDKRVLENLHLEADRFDIEREITAKLLYSRQRIYEVPMSWTGRTDNEYRKYTWRNGMAAASTLVSLRVRCRTSERGEGTPTAPSFDGGSRTSSSA